MKKIIISFALLLALFDVQGQNKVKWGEPFKREGSLFSSLFPAGIDDKYYYLAYNGGKKNRLLAFTHNHVLKSDQTLDIKYGKKKINIQNIIQTATGNYAMMTLDKKGERHFFYAKIKNGKVGKVEKYHSVKLRAQSMYEKMMSNWGKANQLTDNKISENKKYFVQVFKISQDEAVDVIVFDAKFKKIKTVKIENINNVEDVKVTNKGNVVLIEALRKKKKSKKKALMPARGTYNTMVAYILKDKLQKVNIDLGEGKSIENVVVFENHQTGAIYVAGFYENKDSKNDIEGTYFAIIDKDKVKVKISNLDVATIEKINNNKIIGPNISGPILMSRRITYYNLKTLASGNNRYSFSADRITQFVVTTSDGSVKVYFNGSAILIPTFSSNGKLVDIEVIDRSYTRQLSEVLVASNSFENNGKVYIVYPDGKTIKEKKALAEQGHKKRGVFTEMAVIGKDGKLERTDVLFSTKDIKTLVSPKLSFQYKDKAYLYGWIPQKKIKFGTLLLK